MARLERFEQDNRIGYKDENGKVVIKVIYDDGPMCFGVHSKNKTPYACVAKFLSCGVIDEMGNEIIPLEYEEIIPLFDNLFAVRRKAENDQWNFGVIDGKGNILIPFNYKYIANKGEYIECFRTAKSSRYYISSPQLMDKDGRVFSYYDYQDSEWFNHLGEIIYKGDGKVENHGFLIIKEDTGLGVIDSYGSIIIPTKFKEIHCIREDRFVLRLDSEESWRFGVMDNKGNVIIPFDYKFISFQSDAFYECYKECTCEDCISSSNYTDKNEVAWHNRNGELVCTQKSKIISDEFLAVQSSNDKWGVFNQSLQRIVNFIYDNVTCIQDRIIVLKDECVGILNNKGSIIINPSYLSIECVTPEKNSKFDTSNDNYRNILVDPIINFSSYSLPFTILSTGIEKFNFDSYFIVSTNEYSELFSIKEGILANSRFEEIRQLTDVSFAVRKNDKWGVYRVDISNLIIECDYDRIVFEGRHVVLLQKDGLWGAKTITISRLHQVNFFKNILEKEGLQGIKKAIDTIPDFKFDYEVDIPTNYEEIKILDSSELLFGVKTEGYEYDFRNTIKGYTIIDNKGLIYREMHKFNNLTSQFSIFNSNLDRILTSNEYNKWGFISVDGYIAIPFQYDVVELRDDGFFNVCIGNTWGVLDISGKEIVGIKYTEMIPNEWTQSVIQNVQGGRFGVLSNDGSELVPSIYEYLMVKDGFIFYTHHCDIYKDKSSFFCRTDGYSCVPWGVMDLNGRIIIKPEYYCYKVQDGFLLAGRDGRMLRDDYVENYYYNYNGVYDLYSPTGDFIFGGFSEFYYDKKYDVYIFYLGGEWTDYYETTDELGYKDTHVPQYEHGNGLWLFLDKNFMSILRDENGNQLSFKKARVTELVKEYTKEKRHSFFYTANQRISYLRISKVEIEYQEENTKSKKYNIPISVMADGFRPIEKNKLIIRKKNGFSAVDIETGQQTPSFDEIKFISENLYFFGEMNKIGIRDNTTVITPAKYRFCTCPVEGFFFAAEDLDKKNSRLSLLSVYDKSLQIIAIDNIETKDLIDKTTSGGLYIYFNSPSHQVKDIIVPKLNLFDESFVELVSQFESGYRCKKFYNIYWYSSDYRLEKPNDDDDYNQGYSNYYDADNSYRDAFEDDPEAYWNID